MICIGLLDLKSIEIATVQQNHWLIENRCNWVKDVVMSEDLCKTKSHNASRCLGALRDLVLGVAYNDGEQQFTEYTTRFAYQPKKFLENVRSLEIQEFLSKIKLF